MNKILINFIIPSIDRDFDLEVPINIGVNTLIDLLQKSVKELTNNAFIIKDNVKLYDKNTGDLINKNNIVKDSGMTNGSCIMLI